MQRPAIKQLFRRLSLVQKFSMAIILLIFLAGVIFSTLIISRQRSSLRAEMEYSHLTMVRNLAKDAVEALVLLDPLRLDELVRTISLAPGVTAVGVLDQGSRIVAHTNRKLLGSSRRLTITDEQVLLVPEEGTREIIVPVRAGTEIVGTVFASFSKDRINNSIDEDMRKLTQYILAVSVGIGLLGIWGALLLARFLTTPLKQVKEQMGLIQAGNLDVAVPQDYLPTCVDILHCRDRDCPAHGRLRCWDIPGTRCGGEIQADPAAKLCVCKACPVYREYCGDEIGEVTEVFNQMVRRLKASVSELEETTREKARLEKLSALGEMSMTVAHEIKNPLNAIRGATTYLKDNFEGEVLQEFLSIIDEETRRLNEIVTSILRYAKPTPLRLEPADLNRVIRETAELVRQEATEANVELTLSLDEALPVFSFDSQQFKQALLNLLVNALDATRAGDTISISTRLADSRALVILEDTGKGMSREIVADIFKPFFTTKTRGSGLGLSCVERIIRDHRGEITASSEEGKGTEFRILLPLWS